MDPFIRITESEEELRACLALRRTVFIEEQGVPEADELDELDAECAHFLARERPGGRPLGTARLWITPEGRAKAQRVAVRKELRGRGVGRALMAAVEEEARRRGHEALVLSAQLSAVPFYEGIGYQGYGEVFDDAGIPHRNMKKRL